MTQPGDWVRSYSKGIWQVVHRIPDHYDPRLDVGTSRRMADGPLFLLKRILDGSGNPRFATEVAHKTFVKPASKADKSKLEKMLMTEPNLLAEFESFDQPVSAIWNVGVSLPKKMLLGSFKREMSKLFSASIQAGMTSDAILEAIASSSYAGRLNQVPISATLQFISPNYEVQNSNLVYRQFNILTA